MATLSILGLYRYNPNLFDGLEVPQSVDKQILVDNILNDYAELECLYTDPGYFQWILTRWAARRLPVWSKLETTLSLEYNPLDNYDRHEESTVDDDGSGTGSSTYNTDGNSTNVSAATAFNSDTFKDTGKATGSNQSEATGTNTNTSKNKRIINSRIHGNIGVTTSMQLVGEELELNKVNLYTIIMEEFRDKFCLLIY